jgi:hypothetical protein
VSFITTVVAGNSNSSHITSTQSVITNNTTRSSTVDWFVRERFPQELTGELGNAHLSEETQAQVLQNHNPDTIQALTLKLSLLLSQPIFIGTSADALKQRHEQKLVNASMRQALEAFGSTRSAQHNVGDVPNQLFSIDVPSDRNHESSSLHSSAAGPPSTKALHWEPSLIIHSPDHAAGKTLLVQAIANNLKCQSIHLIPAAALVAKYGIHADAGLESLLHGIIISAAVAERSVCIILDHLDVLLPPRLSGRTVAGDAAGPVLNAIGTYVRAYTLVKRKGVSETRP